MIIQLDAFQALADYLESEIPELAGKVAAHPLDPNVQMPMESVGIEPNVFKFHPDQAEFVASVSFDTIIESVGYHEVDCRLMLVAPTARKRAVLAEKVVNAFLSPELSPGVIALSIPQAYSQIVTWELVSYEWEPERVFDKKWYSTLDIKANIPALVTRGGVYTIEELRIAIYHDTSEDLDTVVNFDDLEVIFISEDGEIAPVT
jgi:hypothetical protein